MGESPVPTEKRRKVLVVRDNPRDPLICSGGTTPHHLFPCSVLRPSGLPDVTTYRPVLSLQTLLWFWQTFPWLPLGGVVGKDPSRETHQYPVTLNFRWETRQVGLKWVPTYPSPSSEMVQVLQGSGKGTSEFHGGFYFGHKTQVDGNGGICICWTRRKSP